MKLSYLIETLQYRLNKTGDIEVASIILDSCDIENIIGKDYPKDNVDEIIGRLQLYFDNDLDDHYYDEIDRIVEIVDQQRDEDYKLYLKLKERFENN